MNQNDFLIKEAERQRKLLRDSGLDLRNAQLSIAASAAIPLNEAIKGMQEYFQTSNLDKIAKIQKNFIEHFAKSQLFAEIGNFKKIHDNYLSEQALRIGKLVQPIQVQAMVNIAQQLATSSQLRDLQDAYLRNGILVDHIAESMRPILEAGNFVTLNASLGNFQQSFAADLLARFPIAEFDSEAELDETELEELREKQEAFISFFLEKLRNLDPAWINFITIFCLFWGLWTFARQEYSNDQMEKRLMSAITGTETELSQQNREIKDQITKELERLIPETPEPTLYVVKRTARLKLSLKPRSVTVAILPANQPVELLAKRGKWIYVEFFDYIEGVPRQGWVLKKYLKQVPNRAIK